MGYPAAYRKGSGAFKPSPRPSAPPQVPANDNWPVRPKTPPANDNFPPRRRYRSNPLKRFARRLWYLDAAFTIYDLLNPPQAETFGGPGWIQKCATATIGPYNKAPHWWLTQGNHNDNSCGLSRQAIFGPSSPPVVDFSGPATMAQLREKGGAVNRTRFEQVWHREEGDAPFYIPKRAPAPAPVPWPSPFPPPGAKPVPVPRVRPTPEPPPQEMPIDHPVRGPSPAPNPNPVQSPISPPGVKPDPVIVPRPRPDMPGQPDPGDQPDPGERPVPDPPGNPSVDITVDPFSGVRVRQNPRRARKPRRDEKEKKVFVAAPIFRIMSWTLGTITETMDFATGVYKGVPKCLRPKGFVSTRKQLDTIWKHWDEIDWSIAVGELLAMQVEDRIIGEIAQRANAQMARQNLQLGYESAIGNTMQELMDLMELEVDHPSGLAGELIRARVQQMFRESGYQAPDPC